MTLSCARLAAAVAALALAGIPAAAMACSTCKCGDYTITLMGAEKPFQGRLRGSVEYVSRSEMQGSGIARRETDEQRTLVGLAYSVTPSLTIAAQLPFVQKRITDPATLGEAEARGLGDMDLTGRLVLYQDRAFPRHMAGLRLGIRLPTAEEVTGPGGGPLDIDVQPDAGATAPNAGAWYGYYRFPWFASVSATYFWYGDGRQGFEPGDATLLSLLSQRAIGQTFALQLGVDARYARPNSFSGVTDPDSGGTLAMAYAGVAARFLSDELLINVGIQEPVLDNLNGVQEEGTTWRAGVTYDFSLTED